MKKTVLMSAAKKARIALAVLAVCGMSFVGAQSAFAENVTVDTNKNIICGDGAKAEKHPESVYDVNNAIILGNNAEVGGGAAIAIGKNAKTGKKYLAGMECGPVAIGSWAQALEDAATAVGGSSRAKGYHSTAIGYLAVADGEGSVAIGRGWAEKERSMAIGHDSRAKYKNSIAIGYESVTDAENTVSVGSVYEEFVSLSPDGTIVYKKIDNRRRITYVADGVDDHDAATVGQVKSMIAAGGAGSITTEKFNEMLNNNDAFNSLKNNMNGKADVDGGNIDKSQWANKLGTGAIANGDKNLVNGETVYNKIGDTSQLTNANLGNNLSDAVITVNTKAEDNKKKIGDTTKLTNAGLGDNLSDAVVKVNDKVGDTSKLTTANLGNNLSDAVVKVDDKTKQNAKDIEKVNGRVDELGGRVDTLGGAVAKLDSRVNKVGAGAAALAALHPMEFDSDNKLSFAAGVGNYRGTNAAAIGAFYRPSEQVMFSISGNMGNGENMVNAGVSFALDRPSKTPTTKAALVKTVVAQNEQIAALNETVAEQNEKIARLEAMVEKLAAKQNA